jgi:protein gp37
VSEQSGIEWTDATWNPVRGCVKVSPGCKHCYAETFAERWRGVKGHAYEQGFDLRLVPEKLTAPLSWKKPRRVFVNSMSDLFQDGVPDEFIGRVFDTMAQARRHTFQILTKRPGRMATVVPTLAARHTAEDGSGWPLPNVWLGVSVENQQYADARIPLLLETPAAVRFISAEPLLGSVDVAQYTRAHVSVGSAIAVRGVLQDQYIVDRPALDWVIVGGESGPGARPMQIAWARAIVAQCQAASVPVFCKQLGARPVFDEETEHADWLFTHIRHRKGADPAEWPADLRVRDFPVGDR